MTQKRQKTIKQKITSVSNGNEKQMCFCQIFKKQEVVEVTAYLTIQNISLCAVLQHLN